MTRPDPSGRQEDKKTGTDLSWSEPATGPSLFVFIRLDRARAFETKHPWSGPRSLPVPAFLSSCLPKILIVLLALAAAPARANPLDAFGFGARGIAMGGAHTAAVTDTSANYYNPASLAATAGSLQIDLGYQFHTAALELNRVDQRVDDTRGLAAGLIAPGEVGPLRLAFGISLFLPDERLTRVRSLPASAPRFIYYDNRPQRVFLAANLAVRVLPGLYVGGGMAFMSRTQGDVVLEGRIGFPDAEDSELRLGLDVDLVAIRYPQVGALWVPRDGVAIGLVYRHAFVLELDQGFVIRGDVGPRDSEPILEDGYLAVRSLSSDLFQPAQVVLGLALRPAPRWLAALDLSYQRWSGFDTPGSRIELRYDLKTFNDLVRLPVPAPLQAARFSDVLSPRAGVERRFDLGPVGLYVRGGYAYEPSPVPEQVGETNLADGDKHTVSGGLGLELVGASAAAPGRVGLDVFAGFTHLVERRANKARPSDDVGDWIARGHLWSTGATLRAGF